MFKYCVHPGYVYSKNDGDKHFIDAGQLIKLYKVNPEECRVIIGEKDFTLSDTRGYDCSNFICLYPKFSGNYSLSTHPKEKNGTT